MDQQPMNKYNHINHPESIITRHRFVYLLRALILAILALILLFLYPALTGNAQNWKAKVDVNIRDAGNMNSQVIGYLKKGTKVEQTGTDGHWIIIRYKGKTGYVYRKFMKKVADTRLYVKADAVNLREKPGTESPKLGLLYQGEKVIMLSSEKEWYKVKTAKEKTGYVCAEFMSLKPVKPSPKPGSANKNGEGGETGEEKAPEPSFRPDKMTGRRLSEGSAHAEKMESIRSQAIEEAKKHLDEKYSQGKRNTKGFVDCSSLMRNIFRNVTGQHIGDTTVSQVDAMNEFIYPISSVYDVSPGDLVYHMTSDNHTGIYLGDGQVLHASQGKGKVIISSFPDNGSYWEYGCNAALFCILQ